MAIYTTFKIQAPKLVNALQDIGIKVTTWNGGFSESSEFKLPSGVTACIFDEHAWGETLYGPEEMGLPRSLQATDASKSLAVWLVKCLCGFNSFAEDNDNDDSDDSTAAFCQEFRNIIEEKYPGSDKWQKIEAWDSLIDTAKFLYLSYWDGYDLECEYIEVSKGRMQYRFLIGDDDICDGWHWRNLEEFVPLVKNVVQPTPYERNCSQWVACTNPDASGDYDDVNADCNDNQSAWIVDYPIIKEIQGTGYEGRSARLEYIQVGDAVNLKADYNSPFYSPVAIEVFNTQNETLGYLQDGYGAKSLIEIAKHLDAVQAKVASVTPLSKRTKRAKHALMDVEISVDPEK